MFADARFVQSDADRLGDQITELYAYISAATRQLLLMTAKHGTANQLERLVAQYRRARKFEKKDFAFNQYESREVDWRYDENGCVVLRAKLPPDMGEVILKALDKAIDVAEVKDGGVAARRADALADIAEAFLSNSDSTGSTADRYQVVVHALRDSATVENGPDVSAETSIAKQHAGERLDYDHALIVMMQH